MALLILIDSRVPDVESILATLTPETESIVFDYSTDTFETIQSKILKPYTSVAIAQHKYGEPTFQLLASMSPALLSALEQTEPELNSWAEFSAFLLWLKNNGANTIDLLACDLWADMNWRYAILKMRETMNMTIRASIDITGADGNFVLESDNADMVGLYFTPEISNYKYNFATQIISSFASSFGSTYVPVVLPSSNPGTVPATSYSPFIGFALNNSTSTPLLADISNVLSVHVNSSSAVAVLKTDGTVVTYGSSNSANNVGGNSSSVQSQLYNITKIVSGNQSFAALRSDGVVIAWGVVASATDTSSYVTYASVQSSLVNITNIWATDAAFIALTSAGKVITFGAKTFGGEIPSVYTSYLTSGVTKVAVSRCAVLFIKSDGNAYLGGQAYGTSMGSIYNTNPVIEGYISEGTAFVVRSASNNTKQITNINGQTLLYTIPAGVNIIRDVKSYQYGKFYILLSNNVLLQMTNNATAPTVINNVTDIVVNERCAAYLQNGSVVLVGTAAGFGSNPTDATYGIPSGVSLTNIRRLVSAQSSFAAITFDNNFIWWGTINEPYASSYSSSTFPTFNAKTTSIHNKLANNVASVYSCYQGYVISCLDGSMVSLGTTGFQYGNVTTNFATKNANKNVYFVNNEGGFVPIDIPNAETVSLSSNYQYANNVVSYYNSNPDVMALSGRKYTLYNGSTVVSTWYCINDTFTYVFSDVVFETLGNVTLSIYDTPDLTTSKTLVGTFTVTILVNPFITAPSSPSITSSVVGSKQLTVNFTEPDLSGGMPILGYKYSYNSGASYTIVPSTSDQFVLSDIPLQNYTVLVKAYNIVGDSSAVEIAVTMYNTPNAPTITSVVPGSSQAQVYFTAGNMNFSTFSGYKYSIDGVNYYWTKENTSPITITGLPSGTPYNVTLKCVSENAGTSVASNQSSFTTSYPIPNIPTITSVTAGNGVASVYYSDASSNGAPITKYKYSLNGGTYIDVSSGSPIVITGLTNGTLYSVAIQSANSSGSSGSSNSLAFVPYSVPAKPSIATIISSANKATVYVQPGNNNGSEITSYSYSINNGTSFVSTGNANNNFTITGLTNGTGYFIKVIATNSAGNSVPSDSYSTVPLAEVPNAPTITTVTTGNNVASVYYTDGSSNGSVITMRKYSLNGGSYVDVSSASPIVITGLTNGTPYSVTIKSMNSAGLSGSSNSLAFVPYTVPSKPSITTVVSSFNQVTVHVEPVNNNGSAVTNYSYSLNNGTFVSTGKANSVFTITGLTNGTEYAIRVIATNSAGNSASSDPYSAIPSTIPDAPTITAVTAGNGVASVYYTDGSSNGAPITMRKYSLNGGSYTNVSSASPIVIAGLTNGIPYSVALQSVNSTGTSVPSNSLPFVPCDVPSKPSIINIISSINQATVYVQPGNNNGGEITSYSYSLNDSSFVSTGNANNSFTITGLTNGTTYSIKVIATNATGNSVASDTENTTPYGFPYPPKDITVTAISGGLSVSFTDGSNNGAPILYYLYSLNGGAYVPTQKSSDGTIRIFDLTNGVSYSVKLRAVNQAGASMIITSVTGTSTSAVVVDRPVSPTITKVTPGNGCAYVHFSEIVSNGAPIEQFYYSLNGLPIVALDASGLTSPLTIPGLTNKLSYNIAIASRNSTGVSQISNSMTITAGIPDAPRITSVVSGAKSLIVKFVPPYDIGIPLTGYLVGFNGSSTPPTKASALVDASGGSYIVIPKLINGLAYVPYLRAVNAIGTSAISNTFDPVIPAEIPTTIKITAVVPYLQGSLVYFAIPANNGQPITTYKYAINASTEFIDLSGTTSPLAIYNTPINSAFTIKLIATNLVGNSIPSAPSKPVTFVYLPPAQIKVTALTMPNKNTLSVAFALPALNGSLITKYKYALNGSSDYIDVSGTSLPLIITNGIVPNVDYNIRVIAVNSSFVNNGESVPSLPFSKPVRFIYFLPDKPPIINSIIGGNTTAIVSLTPPAIRGAPIIGYAYSMDASGLILNDISGAVSSPFTITGLTNDISYNIRIAAKTELGYSPISLVKQVIPVYKAPSAPAISGIIGGNNILNVSFAIPLSNGAPITGYNYTVNGGAKIPVVLNPNGNSFIVSKNVISSEEVPLVNGTQYSIQMSAINELGESPLSGVSTGSPIYTVPSIPLLSSASGGRGIITVSFTPSSPNGGVISGYKYILNGGVKVPAVLSSSGSSFVINKNVVNGVDVLLTAATSYSIQICATNELGDSPLSIVKSATTRA